MSDTVESFLWNKLWEVLPNRRRVGLGWESDLET